MKPAVSSKLSAQPETDKRRPAQLGAAAKTQAERVRASLLLRPPGR